MQMAKVLGEKIAASRRDRAAKSDGFGDTSLAESAGIRIPERIGKVGDRLLDDAFQKHAIVAQFLVDSRGTRLREVDVSRRVAANRDQWMGGKLAEFFAVQAFSQRKRRAVDPIRRNEFLHVWEQRVIAMNLRFKSEKCALLCRAIRTVESLPGDLNRTARGDEFRQAEPPSVEFTGDHSGGNEYGERSVVTLHYRQCMGEVVEIAIIEGKGREEVGRRLGQTS